LTRLPVRLTLPTLPINRANQRQGDNQWIALYAIWETMTRTQVERIIRKIRILPGVDANQYKHLLKAIQELEAAMTLIPKPRFFSKTVEKPVSISKSESV
jgi:hypothetical protein